ncbi:hypothetical protein H7J07_05605 [Mycobacterium koreense]|nr:hypothetical protein [Mycolicibacillus koreensis]MCV7247700.1 hypothetical protein [Mycolicibacillus koreensis]BBY54085.1 hypothetical protein MKOR_13360 [Mycolicibacillus koreensis]
MNIKNAMLIPAVASIAVATAAVCFADPSDTGGDDNRSVDAQGTVTVTATVAPDQCEPVAGGPTATEANDSGDKPANPADAEEGAADAEGTGISTSRFDPYTCAPVPASDSDRDKPSDKPETPQQGPEHTYEPPLQKLPADSGGSGPAHGPLSDPTTTSVLPPLPGPGN